MQLIWEVADKSVLYFFPDQFDLTYNDLTH